MPHLIGIFLEIQTDSRYNKDTLIGLASGGRREYGYEVKPTLSHGVILPSQP